MTRRSLISSLASALLASSGLLACGRADLSTVKLGALCFPPDDCTFSSTCDKVNIEGQLWVDLAATNMLVYPIQIDNQRPDSSGTASGGTTPVAPLNIADANIDRFEMTYEGAGASIPGATSIQSLTVAAAGSTVAAVFLIPPNTDAEAALATLPAGTLVTVKLRAHGYYNDGSTFETGEHPVPVILENGLFSGYSCTDTTKTVKSICPMNPGQIANVVCG